MCDASQIMMASTAVSAIGNLMEGKQTQTAYNFKADQAEADAAYEIGAAEVRASKIRKAGALQQKSVTAGYAGAGIDISQGTPLAVGNTLERNIGEDATAQLLTGQRRAAVLNSEAAGYRAAGSRSVTSGYLNAGRSLLSGTAATMDAATKNDKWIRKQQLDFQAQKKAEFDMGGGYVDAEM